VSEVASIHCFQFIGSGELYTWGLNGPSCRLGLGNNEHAFIPRLVPIDRKVVDLSLGTNHVLATCIE
jgi:alpha-tubulin suppressor-like RCC1 family protein